MFRDVQGQFGSLDIFVSKPRPEIPAFFQDTLDSALEQWDTDVNVDAKAFGSRRVRFGSNELRP